MSAEEPFAIPFRNDGVCPSPLCISPHLPVDFDLVRSLSVQFYLLLQSAIVQDACTYAENVFKTEFCFTGVLERRILERYDSKEFSGTEMDQEEDDAELARLVDAVFEDGKGGVPASILVELGICLDEAILQLFTKIQEIVEANCDPATLQKQPSFCFHSIAECAAAFKPAVRKFREAHAKRVAERVPTGVDATRLRKEIASAVSSGRWRGGGNVERILAGASSSFVLSCTKVLNLVTSRIKRLVNGRFLIPLEYQLPAFSLVYEFNRYSNDKPSFFRSVNYQSFLQTYLSTHIPRSSATPSSPAPLATGQPIQPSPTAFTGIHDPRPFTQTSLLLPPTVCSPDRCSGQLPIAANFGLVDSMLMELLGWRFMTAAIKDFDYELLVMAAVEIAERGGTLSVSSEEGRKRFLAAIPATLEGVSACAIVQERSRDSMLARELRELQHLLFSMQRTRLPCICDLTHLTEELAAEIATAKADYDLENTLLSDIIFSDDATEHLVDVMTGAPKIQRIRPPAVFSDQGWRNEVNRYTRFMYGPISRAIRSSRFDIRCLETWRCMILQMGGMGVLEEIWAFAFGDYPVPDDVERMVPALQSLVEDAFAISPVEAIEKDQKAATKAEKENDLRVCLHLFVKICILDPTNHSARLNSAAIRLRLGNDTDRKFQWSRASYDCTMALYYGPPSFKAYYRRGLALAHLKLWKKAILDFERALEIEPGNVVVIEQMKLARMRRS